MANTKIEWADKVWNPITGCTPVSSGCANCYARRMANRLKGRYGYPKDEPFRVTFHLDRLNEPLRWKRPSRIFVCSMGDLFHENIKPEWIDAIWEVMAACHQHTFMVLTKRPQNIEKLLYGVTEECGCRELGGGDYLPNVWIGVSCEDQKTADERIPILLQIPAAKRWVSVEPLLSSVDLLKWLPEKGGGYDKQRSDVLGAGGSRLVHGGFSGENLETCEMDGGRGGLAKMVECSDQGRAECSQEGQLPKSDVQTSGETLFGGGTSDCLDDSESEAYSGRYGDQSQGRKYDKYSPKEFRIGNEIPKHDSFISSDRPEDKATTGREKRVCKDNRSASGRNSDPMGRSVNDTERDRRTVRDKATDCSEYSIEKKLVTPSLDWVVCGGETGPRARPPHPDWVRSLRDQCQAAGVPFFFKSWGEWLPVGQKPACVFKPIGKNDAIDRFYLWNDEGKNVSMKIDHEAAGHLLDGKEYRKLPKWPKTGKEVNAEKIHKIPIGALVEIKTGVRLFVVYHGRDCDQTPLY